MRPLCRTEMASWLPSAAIPLKGRRDRPPFGIDRCSTVARMDGAPSREMMGVYIPSRGLGAW